MSFSMRFSKRPWIKPVDIDAGRMDLGGLERARCDDFFDFDHGDAPGRRGRRVEVLRGISIDDVAEPVRFPSFDEREVGDDGFFENVLRGP